MYYYYALPFPTPIYTYGNGHAYALYMTRFHMLHGHAYTPYSAGQKFWNDRVILSEIPPHTYIPHYYYLITMAPTNLRARTRLAYKYHTLSIRGRIIGRRRGGAIYKVIVVAEKIPKTIIFNTIKLANTRLS